MATQYFENFPNMFYSNTLCKDLTRRTILIAANTGSVYEFYPYEISNHLRTDHIAEYYYNEPALEWLINIANKNVDPYYGWYQDHATFETSIIEKYGSIVESQQRIKHYINNWADDDVLISKTYYENTLVPVLRKYYEPVYGQTLDIINYRRKPHDLVQNTNQIWHYTVLVGEPEELTNGTFGTDITGNLLADGQDLTAWETTGTPIVTANTVEDDNASGYELIQSAVILLDIGTTYDVRFEIGQDAVGQATRFPILRITDTTTNFDFNIDTATGEIKDQNTNLIGEAVVDQTTHWECSFSFVATDASARIQFYPAVGDTALGSYTVAGVGTSSLMSISIRDPAELVASSWQEANTVDVSITGGRVRIENEAGSAYGKIWQVVDTIVGETYNITADHISQSSGIGRVMTRDGAGPPHVGFNATVYDSATPGAVSTSYVALQTQTVFMLGNRSDTLSVSVWDNFSVKRAIADDVIPFQNGELVRIKDHLVDATVGWGEISTANSTIFRIKNVSGNTVANSTVVKDFVGFTSGANVTSSDGQNWFYNISNSEFVFYSAVSFYDWELEQNEKLKTINIVGDGVEALMTAEFERQMKGDVDANTGLSTG